MNDDNSHNDERFEELCAGYVLNALEPEEREAFERMLEHADEDRLELYRRLKSAANNLAFGSEKQEAPEAVKERLLRVIEEDLRDETVTKVHEQDQQVQESAEREPVAAESESGVNRTTMAIAASIALLFVSLSLLFYSLNLNRQLENRNGRIEEQESVITQLEQELERKDELLAILESREVNMVVMRGMEASPDGYGKIIWDAEQQQALLQVSNLPPVPNDMEYQLWVIRDNTPVSAGMFAVHDPKRDAFFKIEQMDSTARQATNAFAVTLEPKGGMPQPTGDMYLMGNMEN